MSRIKATAGKTTHRMIDSEHEWDCRLDNLSCRSRKVEMLFMILTK